MTCNGALAALTPGNFTCNVILAAGANSYVAVLMDCHMPEMDGFETTQRIRALPAPFGKVPIIALTASTSAEDLSACLRSGMNEVLAKPVSLETLQRVLPRGQ